MSVEKLKQRDGSQEEPESPLQIFLENLPRLRREISMIQNGDLSGNLCSQDNGFGKS